MKPKNTIQAILDALASQRRQGETSLIIRIEPNLIQDAMNALPSYRKLFAPVVPGLTDPLPIYEAYERVRQADGTEQSVLLLVKCHTTQEFREALDRLQSTAGAVRVSRAQALSAARNAKDRGKFGSAPPPDCRLK